MYLYDMYTCVYVQCHVTWQKAKSAEVPPRGQGTSLRYDDRRLRAKDAGPRPWDLALGFGLQSLTHDPWPRPWAWSWDRDPGPKTQAPHPVNSKWSPHIYGSFLFVGSKANIKECALWSHSTWVHSGPWVYISIFIYIYV